MIKIKETIIVEGIYDKIKLSRFIDGIIFVTGGFSIMNNKDKLTSLKTLASKTGVVILTDADSAGFRIRSYLKQHIPENQIKHAYIPDISGKEKRKTTPGKEGLLGVEGMSEDVLIEALKKAGCELDGIADSPREGRSITKADLFSIGLSGGANSAILRNALCRELGLPSKISANMMLDVLNRLLTFEELKDMVQNIS